MFMTGGHGSNYLFVSMVPIIGSIGLWKNVQVLSSDRDSQNGVAVALIRGRCPSSGLLGEFSSARGRCCNTLCQKQTITDYSISNLQDERFHNKQ
jgi:hypothetical protein